MNQDVNSWRGVQAELLRRINEREWVPGSLLPTEAELAGEFGCARTTVNRAMRELAEAGLLDRKRRAGTRVALHPTSRVVLDIPIIRQEVEQRGARWHHALLEQRTEPAPTSVTSRMDLSAGTKMLHVRSLHFADNHPFLLEDRWLNLAALADAETVDFGKVTSNEWLIQNVPYTTGDISFSAISTDADTASLLEAQEGEAVFVVDRLTWNEREPITSVRLTYAPGYRLNTRV
ncbi:GntR family transcriptional regulator [Pseudoruegeria sp. HB172150]|uniref:GntR family transcriptional regulator n=1 Tax=Pseudoruegeria sp. HB172150 TaxID=2721164 RepID=UPI0015561F2B|nr:GntR family transcriptional regulator [Pseudoruegeria sp. HB172150]